MELVLGHVTWYQNLRTRVDSARPGRQPLGRNDAVRAEGGLLERMPGVPGFVRAGARALARRTSRAARLVARRLVFNTHKAAMLCQWDMLRTPTILMTDVTPAQYDRWPSCTTMRSTSSAAVRPAKHAVNVAEFPPRQRVRRLLELDARLA